MDVIVRFKTADDKTSLLFHNDLCQDEGSLSVTVYNSGMMVAELMLQNKKATTTIVFGVGLDGVNIEICGISATITIHTFGGFCPRRVLGVVA